MARRDLIVVGASAGGVEALRGLLGSLPAGLPAAVLVVLHMPASSPSALPAILDRASALPVRQAQDGDALEPGTVLVAVPDRHLMVVDGHVALSRGPRENGHRPAVDVLFRSAARARGARTVGVVLSGALDDGTAGTIAVRSRGGLVVVQDPDDAVYPSMPRHALEVGGAEHAVPVAAMGELLAHLLEEPVDPAVGPPATALMETETAMADFDATALNADDRPGTPSGFGCPSCHGALFSLSEGGLERYRCRVGHAWSPESLLAEQAQALESALWTALRGLEERAALSRRMGERADRNGHALTARTFFARHDESHRAALVIRHLLQDGDAEHGPVSSPVGDRLGDPVTDRDEERDGELG
ncbi:chemotaxis protein CheB [Modestobacter sp. NPDC049651]|uniref:chemotaxis protein CheB n=1 Tax=unclassified Modestobacter TaxID=2643866 RepID=UPI00340DEC3C